MPRLTSFVPDGSESPINENEWVVTNCLNRGLLSTKGWIAARRDVIVEIGFDGGPNRTIDCVNYSYLVRMVIQDEEVKFTTFPRSEFPKTVYRVYPEVLTIAPVSTRIEVVTKGQGKAIYRPAWKDFDAAKSIQGFIDTAGFSSVEAEEAIVWLLGTLAIRGLPQVIPAGG